MIRIVKLKVTNCTKTGELRITVQVACTGDINRLRIFVFKESQKEFLKGKFKRV